MSTLCKVSGEDKVVTVINVKDFKEGTEVVMASSAGKIKRTPISDFEVQRYSKAMRCFKLGAEEELVGATISDGSKNIMLFTEVGYANKFLEEDISITGIKSGGVKGITIRDDKVVGLAVATEEEAVLFTTHIGQAKRM
jgi:topoisomerase-4 subunit A